MGKRGPEPGAPEVSLANNETRQQIFLDALAQCGSIKRAARIASPHSKSGADATFRGYAARSPEFSARIDEALDAYKDSLIAECQRRGRDGFQGRALTYKGEIIGHERAYSDQLLILEMRRLMPEYREKSSVEHEHKVKVQPMGAWTIAASDLEALTKAEVETLKGLFSKVMDHRRGLQARDVTPPPMQIEPNAEDEGPDENGDVIPY